MKRIVALFLILVLALSFAGCGEKEKNNVIIEGIKEPEGNPERGGVISIYSYKPDTLCPLLSKNNANIRMLNIIYDGLFTVDSNLTVIPCLATEWENSADNTRYKVTLRDGVLFHDGSRLSADDVIFSVETALNEPQGLYYYNVKNIKEVKKLSDAKVEFVLNSPTSNFQNLLDFPIIKKQAAPIDAENFYPVGTGGFIFENRNEGNLFHLVRNDNWWGGEVYLDSVKVRLLPDKDTAIYAFSSGEISICPAENSEWGKFVDAQTASYKEYMTEQYNFIGLNHKNPMLSKKEIRTALLYAIDTEAVLKAGTADFCESANAPLRKNWYNIEKKEETEKNINKARNILKENNWEIQNGVYKSKDRKNPSNLSFEILINEESYKKEKFAEKLIEELTNFGVLASVRKLPFDKYNEAISKGNYDIFLGSINLSKETDFLNLLGEGNMFFHSDEEMLNILNSAKLSKDGEEFSLKMTEFIEKFNETVPFLGIGFENNVILYKSEIKGELNPVTNNIYNGIEKLYIKEAS